MSYYYTIYIYETETSFFEPKSLVVNSAARSGEAVEKFSGTLIGNLELLHVQLIDPEISDRAALYRVIEARTEQK